MTIVNSNSSIPSAAREVIQKELEAVLPEGPFPFNVLFYKTQPHKTRPLIYREPPKPKSKNNKDTKSKTANPAETGNQKQIVEQSASKDSKDSNKNSKDSKKSKNLKDFKKLKNEKKKHTGSIEDYDYVTNYFILLTYRDLTIYAIELIVNDVPGGTQTFFVSKADTTGHYGLEGNLNTNTKNGDTVSTQSSSNPPKISYSKVTEAIMRAVIRCFIDPLRPLKITLFARAEKHYLFPFSAEKPGQKHLLSGADLVRWWVKILDDVCKPGETGAVVEQDSLSKDSTVADKKEEDNDSTKKPVIQKVSRARLQIPGSEPAFIRSYFPARQRFANSAAKNTENQFLWQVGDIFWPNDDPKYPALRCIPRFYDDPLTRYLEFLVSVKRSTTTTQKLFWMELQTRQEFRLSIVVGVVGVDCTIDPKQSVYYDNKTMQELRDKKIDEKQQRPALTEKEVKQERFRKKFGINNATSTDKKISEQGGSGFTSVTKWYMDRVHEYVTTLDYEETKMNHVATSGLLAKDKNVLFEIKGRFKPNAQAVDSSGSSDPVAAGSSAVSGGVNVISGLVKKKKKNVEMPAPVSAPVNTLNTMLVRKKPKKK